MTRRAGVERARRSRDTPRVKPIFFESPLAFRAWLDAHHASETELVVGFHKRGTGKPSMTWPESVDEALSFGWIDGVRRSLGDEAYSIRFTPRKPTSIWSAVNVARIEVLRGEGRLRPSGLAAFERRRATHTAVYSFEQKDAARLAPDEERALRAKKKAAAYFDAQAPWYRRSATHWVVSAKKPETRARRLARLIEACAETRPIGPLAYARPPRKSAEPKRAATKRRA